MESAMHRLESAARSSRWKRRQYPRYNLDFPVRVMFQAGAMPKEIETISKNVSLGGLLVRSASTIPQDTLVTFVLSVHGEHGVRPIHLLGEGEIVRVEPDGAGETFAVAIRCKHPVTQLEDYLPM